jgi:heterodisulfide reductase subunit C
MADFMDLMPNQVMRLAQLGRVEEIIKSKTPWICAACLTCTVRCPRGMKIAEVMEAARQYVLRQRDSSHHLNKLNEQADELPPIAVISAFRKIAD